jgi:hypothetical protein
MTLGSGQWIASIQSMSSLSENQSLCEILFKVASYRVSDCGIVQLVL